MTSIVTALLLMLALSLMTACGGGGGASTTGSIQQQSIATGSSSFSLNWVAPVTRTDGSPLSLAEIDGYKVYLGTRKGQYTHYATIADGSQTSATINGLVSNTYHVVMTTYDSNNREGPYSPAITKIALDN